MASKADATDTSGVVVKIYWAIAGCEGGLEVGEKCGGGSAVPAVVYVDIEGEGVERVERACLVECVVVGGGGVEASGGENASEVLVILVVCLLETVAAACDLGEAASEWARNVGGEFGDELVAVRHSAGELVVEEGSGKVEVPYEELREAASVGSVSKASSEDEGTVCGVGGASVSIIVGGARLVLAVDGEARGDDARALAFHEHVRTKVDGGGFDVGRGDGGEGLVGGEVLGKLFIETGRDGGGVEESVGGFDRHLVTCDGEW